MITLEQRYGLNPIGVVCQAKPGVLSPMGTPSGVGEPKGFELPGNLLHGICCMGADGIGADLN